MSAPQIVRRMVSALDEEKSAILAGNFDLLERVQERKTALGESLSHHAVSPEDLQALSARMTRNAALLRAASDGFSDALESIKALKKATGTSVYGKDGSVSRVEASSGKMERKA